MTPTDEIDLWAPVPKDVLPAGLVEAVQRRDWANARTHLAQLMDGITTDGAYGRALLQLVLNLPLGIDPTFDSYRAAASIDHGDWDGLRKCLTHSPIEPVQLLGMRDVLLGPLNTVSTVSSATPYAMLFAPYDYQLSQMLGAYRRWARAMLRFQATELIWARPDVPAGRHIRYRRLQDAVTLAFAEVQAGRMRTALALTLEARHLGDPSEPLRDCARDLEELIAFAMGDDREPRLRIVYDLSKPTGLSPLGAWQVLLHLMPLIAVVGGDIFPWAARLAEKIAARLGSPRAQLASHAWRAAAELNQGQHRSGRHPELPGLRAQSERAATGLRVLPQLLVGLESRKPNDLIEAERLARRAGNTWAQLAALSWISATNPSPTTGRRLAQLLDLTGWRRPVLVPPEIAADAALGIASLGIRGQGLVELASAAGRPNVLLDVALRHIDDTTAPLAARLVAVECLGTLGTSRAGEILSRLSKRNDELGRRAGLVAEKQRRGVGLTDRELEVVHLAAEGLTNREIAERLTLSQHTIARHLANARAKLGAANRTEAAVRVEALEAAAETEPTASVRESAHGSG